jgi:hypothetical protein
MCVLGSRCDELWGKHLPLVQRALIRSPAAVRGGGGYGWGGAGGCGGVGGVGGDGGLARHANWRPSARPAVSQCPCNLAQSQPPIAPPQKPASRSS